MMHKTGIISIGWLGINNLPINARVSKTITKPKTTMMYPTLTFGSNKCMYVVQVVV